ncbi:MAG: HDOD domain-containing protein [Pseudomonadales bacterium]|nr:HDOD domain-containing protein [Pseudomonadales bacterium]
MTKTKKLSVKGWLTHIESTELPMMSGVLQELNALTSSPETQVHQLTEVILKDAVLTSQVLKVANSVFYNPAKSPINTVSRAVVVIGFTGIYSILISSLVTDQLIRENPKPALIDSLYRAFHGAVQAKNLAQRLSDSEREEIYVATLLYNIGELALLSCDRDEVDKLCRALESTDDSREKTISAVIGIKPKQLSRMLAKQWELSELLQTSLSDSKNPDPNVRAVMIGNRIGQQMELGWDSAEMAKNISLVARHIDIDKEDALEQIQVWSEDAKKVVQSFGITPSEQAESAIAGTGSAADITKPQQQSLLQLDILRDLAAMVFEDASINSIFQVLIEGIHRGIDMNQAGIAILDPKNTRLHAKYMIGEDTEKWRESFDFPVHTSATNPLAHCLLKNKVITVNTSTQQTIELQPSPGFNRVFSDRPVIMGPLFAGKKPFGVIFATRPADIEDRDLQSFEHFVNQANLCLAFLSQRTR